jgi:hypothetical protein
MGDRVHLLNKEITINTFVEDLVQVIQSEELTEVGTPALGLCERGCAEFSVRPKSNHRVNPPGELDYPNARYCDAGIRHRARSAWNAQT